MQNLSTTFPELNQLTLNFGPDAYDSSSSTAMLQGLRRVRLPHLHTFSCDVKLKGDLLLAVARFLVHTPSLRVLRLANQRGCSPSDQRVLCAVLEALPHLTDLDLGGAGSSRSASNSIRPSLMRRITKLLPCLQHLSCNAASVPDEQLEALAQLPLLQSLSISAAGSGHGLAAALRRSTHLTSLELQHASLGCELVGCLAGMTGLQVLMLGLCPQLNDGIMSEVIPHLHRLALQQLMVCVCHGGVARMCVGTSQHAQHPVCGWRDCGGGATCLTHARYTKPNVLAIIVDTKPYCP
jgi:hypothetical protein